MRILHTSDWHIGRSFHGTGMLQTQRAVLARLAEVVREQAVDAVLVAGDVYDRALPAADAVAVLDEALALLREAGAVVVLTSGNHDSAVRLGFGGRLMAASGVHLRTSPEQLAEPVELRGADGARALVYGVPYLEPRHLGPAWGVDPHHTAVMAEAMRRVREDAPAHTEREPAAVVVMAHLFAAGGHGSDSERDIGASDPGPGGDGGPVGTLGQVPVTVFDGVDYAALGHLHGRQTMAPHVRYSGSPLAYSFSEAGHRKGAWILDVADGAVQAVTPVDWRVGRGLAVLAGPLEELLSSPVHAAAEDCWVQATVTDDERPPRAFARLQERFEHLLVYRWEPAARREAPASRPRAGRGAVPDLAVAEGFVEHVRSRPVDEAERALLRAAVEAARERSAEEEARA